MESTLFRLAVALSAVIALTCHADIAEAQDKGQVTVKFKIFDTNEPTKRLNPVPQAIAFLRNPVTLKGDLQERVNITRPMKDGLDELKVSKGWLIERLVIDVDDPEKDYNFAAITKVISAADMTIYPGASRSTDRFAFQAYIAQMGAYRALLAEVLEEVDEGSGNVFARTSGQRSSGS